MEMEKFIGSKMEVSVIKPVRSFDIRLGRVEIVEKEADVIVHIYCDYGVAKLIAEKLDKIVPPESDIEIVPETKSVCALMSKILENPYFSMDILEKKLKEI